MQTLKQKLQEIIDKQLSDNSTQTDIDGKKYHDFVYQSELLSIAEQSYNLDRWISTKEALPDNNTECIVYDRSERIIGNVWYHPEKYEWWSDGQKVLIVTHWMTLPSPPNTESK